MFAAELRRVCGLLEERLGVPVTAEVVLAGDGDADGRTDQTLYAGRRGLFAVEVALVRLLAWSAGLPLTR